MNFIQKIKLIIGEKSLRNKILFVLFALVLFRVMAAIPIPGIDAARLTQFLSNNQFFGLLNIFSGGGLSNLSIVMLGVGPYITASIIMQLLTMMSSRLKALYHEEGDAGKRNSPSIQDYLRCRLPLFKDSVFWCSLNDRGF